VLIPKTFIGYVPTANAKTPPNPPLSYAMPLWFPPAFGILQESQMVYDRLFGFI